MKRNVLVKYVKKKTQNKQYLRIGLSIRFHYCKIILNQPPNHFPLLISFVKFINPYLPSYALVFVPRVAIVTIIIVQKSVNQT